MERFEKILTPILNQIMNVSFDFENKSFNDITETKERIKIPGNPINLRNMEIHIYTNDHNPPHFHVKSNDLLIDAKFKIEDGSFISGKIGSSDLKRIDAFYKY